MQFSRSAKNRNIAIECVPIAITSKFLSRIVCGVFVGKKSENFERWKILKILMKKECFFPKKKPSDFLKMQLYQTRKEQIMPVVAGHLVGMPCQKRLLLKPHFLYSGV